MIVDPADLPADAVLDADLCIVGGGPAGITIALELMNERFRIVLLESGGVKARGGDQSLNEGISIGAPYYALDACRLRALGGSTNMWGGWCRPLDADDFHAREWIADSGWPFDLTELTSAYRRAQTACGLGPYDYEPARWRDNTRASPVPSDDRAREVIFQIAPVRFGAQHADALRKAANVTLLPGASALTLEMDEAGRNARRIRVGTLPGKTVTIAAGTIVLAAGGLENARLLLASTGHGANGIGNSGDLVGRYFNDHLHVPIGTLHPRHHSMRHRHEARRRAGTTVREGLSLTESARGEERLLGAAVTFHNPDDPHDVLSPALEQSGYRSFVILARAVRDLEWPHDATAHIARTLRNPAHALSMAYRRMSTRAATRLVIGIRAEQAPNYASRVSLDNSTDRYGVRRLRLDWKISDQDLDSIERTQRILATLLAAERVEMIPRDGPLGWANTVAPGAHHIGTTRMHASPQRGVVDAQCRVHGTENLYVAGSSVFPTGGWAPPTLTIVALSLRLATHLKHRLARQGDEAIRPA